MLIKIRDSIGVLHNLDIFYLGLQYEANIERKLRYSSMYSVVVVKGCYVTANETSATDKNWYTEAH